MTDADAPRPNRQFLNPSSCHEPWNPAANRASAIDILLSAAPAEFRVERRSFADLAPHVGDMYPQLAAKPGHEQAHVTARSESRANLLVLPPWSVGAWTYCGSTLGERIADGAPKRLAVAKICEVIAGHAAVLIDQPERADRELCLLAPSEKAGIPHGSVVAYFGLGRRGTALRIFGNFARMKRDDEIIRTVGPALSLGYAYGQFQAHFNHRYVNRDDGFGTVEPHTSEPLRLPLKLNSAEAVYDLLRSDRAAQEFALRGIRVVSQRLDELAAQMNLSISDLQKPLGQLRATDLRAGLTSYFFGGG